MSLPPPAAAERHAGPVPTPARPVPRLRRRRRRHRGRWLALAALGLVLAYGVRVGLLLLDARADAAALRTDLDRVDLSASVRAMLRGDADPDIARLAASARRLDRRLGSPWLVPLRPVPVIGRQLDAARSVASVADGFLEAATVTGAEVRALRAGGNDADLRTLVETAASAVDRFGALFAAADLGPADGLVTALGSARTMVATALDRVRPSVERAQVALPGLRALVTGRHTFLLAAANNAEMGAGTGSPLAVATLTFDDGKASVGAWEWTGRVVVPDGVPVPAEIDAAWSFVRPQDDMRTAVVSPSFDQVGALLTAQWNAATGAAVEGVIVLDVAGMQSLVDGLGAGVLEGTGLERSSLAKTLLHDQYVGVTNEAPETGDVRRDRMAALGGVLASRTLSGGGDWTGLLQGLADAAKGRHVLAWSSEPTLQRTWFALGAAGALSPDSLLVAVQNRSANKLDWFLDVRGAVTTTAAAAAGTVDVAVRVDMTNKVPAGESRYIAGPFGEGPYGQYGGYLTVNLPGAATDVSIDGEPALVVDHTDGPTRIVGQVVALAPGTSTSVVVRWKQPAAVGLTVEPSGRFPGITWTSGGRTWQDNALRTLSIGPGS